MKEIKHLPPEIMLPIIQSLPVDDLKNFSITSKQYYSFVKPMLDICRFLYDITHRKFNNVAHGLKENIHFTHKKGTVTDWIGRSFFSISGYQYATLVSDDQMLTLMAKSLFGKQEEADIRKRLLAQSDEIKTKSFSYTLGGIIFTEKFSEMKQRYDEFVLSLIYRTMYEWVNTLTERSFESLIKCILKNYERSAWDSWLINNHSSNVWDILSKKFEPAKTLALIFTMIPHLGALNEQLFTRIIKIIQQETVNSLEMQKELRYKVIGQMYLYHDQNFYISKLRTNQQTIDASLGKFDPDQNDVTVTLIRVANSS